jgi:hypothetical protein
MREADGHKRLAATHRPFSSSVVQTCNTRKGKMKRFGFYRVAGDGQRLGECDLEASVKPQAMALAKKFKTNIMVCETVLAYYDCFTAKGKARYSPPKTRFRLSEKFNVKHPRKKTCAKKLGRLRFTRVH